MQRDLFQSGHDLTWGQIFKMTFLGQIIVYSTRLKKRNTMLAKNAVSLLSQKLLQKRNIFRKKRLVLEFLLFECQAIDLRSNLRTP